MTQKVLKGEVTYVQAAGSDLEKALKQECSGGDSTMDDNQPNLIELLTTFENRLMRLKTISHKAVSEEIELAESCKRRIDHLKDGCQTTNSDSIEGFSGDLNGRGKAWQKTRLDRILVEHFLRSGYYDSALVLAQSSGIEDLTNINVFIVAKDVEEALTRQDISKCLAWCHDNKIKLQKINSTLEFKVQSQEFIKLIKRGEKLEAVKHLRKYVSPFTDNLVQLAIIQRTCALLAFDSPSTEMHRYRDLYREDRWQFLIEQFRTENYLLLQLSKDVTDLAKLCNQSIFATVLQTGLYVLKTPQCYQPSGADR